MVATCIVNSIRMKPDEKGVSTGSILAFQPLFITYATCYLFMQVVPKCHSVVQPLDETSQNDGGQCLESITELFMSSTQCKKIQMGSIFGNI